MVKKKKKERNLDEFNCILTNINVIYKIRSAYSKITFNNQSALQNFVT